MGGDVAIQLVLDGDCGDHEDARSDDATGLSEILATEMPGSKQLDRWMKMMGIGHRALPAPKAPAMPPMLLGPGAGHLRQGVRS